MGGINALACRNRWLDLNQPVIMGVLNVTPDSFSDGGCWTSLDAAVTHASEMLASGATIIDIGGESTRPGAAEVSVSEELERVIPVLRNLRKQHPQAILSIDTSKPAVMRAALDAGAHMVNDVNALQTEGALEMLAGSDCGICLMHRQGTPVSMQLKPEYDDVVEEVGGFLAARLKACEAAGIDRRRIALDPGFGFGKTLQHNLKLLDDLAALRELGQPILAGLSRKSMLGKITGADTGDRMLASVVAAVLAVNNGADIVRVHDVSETRQGLRIWQAMRQHAG